MPGQDVIAEEAVLAKIRSHGNGHHIETTEAEAHARKLAYPCPACGAQPLYSCSNDDPLANHCPERGASGEPLRLIAKDDEPPPARETAEQHADRVIR